MTKRQKKLYQAAKHLADSAYAIIKQMGWENKDIPVSYYGGLFKTGDLILEPLRECLKVINCTMIPPKHTAVEGALLLSIKILNKREIKMFITKKEIMDTPNALKRT